MDAAQQAFADFDNVSRETLQAFAQWRDILQRWNARINLVQKDSLADFWTRHAADSWQITPFINPQIPHIVDFGSGAGFPGLAAALWIKQSGGQGRVSLIESVAKKCAFLREVVRALNLPADIYNSRIEDQKLAPADMITARAFAPLPLLLSHAMTHLRAGGELVLLKGAGFEDEIAAAKTQFDFDVKAHPSHTDPGGRILIISALKHL